MTTVSAKPVNQESNVRVTSNSSPTPRGWTVAELSSFYVEHRAELVAHARRILQDGHRAEEIVQDALVRVMLAAPELESADHARSYLHRTVDNLCVDLMRREGRKPTLVLIDDVRAEAEDSWIADQDHVDLISAADDAAIIREAISLLSSSERAALVMWELEGRSSKDIARELGIKESTVRHTVARARKSLRRILSEYVIDQERGLTALDLLSVSYKRVAHVAKKSSKAALSLMLVFFAFLGFGSLSNPQQPSDQIPTSNRNVEKLASVATTNKSSAVVKKQESATNLSPVAVKTSLVRTSNAKASTMKFPGLDSNGVPTAFTITDSSGSLGNLFVTSRDTSFLDSELKISWIGKTMTGAANLLLTQTLTQDVTGTSFDAFVSYGKEGRWIPLNTKVLSTDSERLVGGNYLITVTLQVKSEVETTIVTPASAGGRDLDSAPSRIISRILLNPGKTQVVAQAVQVIERSTK